MKFSPVHCRGVNMHRWTYRQLFYTGRRKVLDTYLYKTMKKMNVPLEDAVEFTKENFFTPGKMLPTKGIRVKPPKLDENHPCWNEKPCLFYRDHNVLTEGLEQAKIFTNTVELKSGLPDYLTSLDVESLVEKQDELIHLALASAIVYDATQVKLQTKKKDPERPMFVFPRDYGIPDFRKNYLLGNHFLHLCELLSGLHISRDRYKFEDAWFSVPLTREEDLIQLQHRADILLLSRNALKPICAPEATLNTRLPNIDPLKYTVSLEAENIYKVEDVYPLNENCGINRIHTAIIHFNETEVKNLYGTPVLETQTISRSLMKAFTICAAHARHLYGNNVEILPEPIVLQCVQTDSKYFHFSVFQLNTLAWPPSDTAIRNVFWSDPIMPAYEFGGFFEGRPTITSYNTDIFKKLLAFYISS